MNGDNLLANPTDGPSYGRYLASDPRRLARGCSGPPRKLYSPGAQSALDEPRLGADALLARARRTYGLPLPAGFSPLAGPRGPMPPDFSPLVGPRGPMPPGFSPLVGPRGPRPADYSPLEGPGRRAGRGASPMPGFPVYGPADIGAPLPRPEISPLDRPTRRTTARDRVATPTIPQYAPLDLVDAPLDRRWGRRQPAFHQLRRPQSEGLRLQPLPIVQHGARPRVVRACPDLGRQRLRTSLT